MFIFIWKKGVFIVKQTQTTDRKASKIKRDSWSKKKWYAVMAPEFLGSKQIADTLALKENNLIGRVIVLPLSEFTGSFRDFKVKVKLKIKDVKGTEAHTEYVGQEMLRDQILRTIRRWSSRVDSIDDVKLKDDSRFRIKSLTVTRRRVNTSVKGDIRHAVSSGIKDYVAARATEQMVEDINSSKMQKIISSNVKKIYPVRTVEVRMIQKV